MIGRSTLVYVGKSVLMTVAVLGAVKSAPAQQLPTRVTIDILVVADDPISAARLKQWSRKLQSRLSQLGADQSLGLARGNQILAKPWEIQDFISSGALKLRWEQRRAIQIVLAQGVRDGDQVTAEGNIYLGTLRGQDLANPLVPIKQPITVNNYQKSSDYIMMTSLYALGVDAGAKRPVACELLRRANLLGRTTASIDSANVRSAVTNRLRRLGCTIGR